MSERMPLRNTDVVPYRPRSTPSNSPSRQISYNTDVITVSLLPGTGFAIHPLTTLQMIVVTLPLFGVALIRQCLFLLATPYLEELGLGDMYARGIWIALPISGLITIPFVGYFSDRCLAEYGRRRPFILFGLVIGCLNILVFAFGRFLREYNNSFGQIVCAVTYVFGVLGFQIIQTPLRALILDVAISRQQINTQAMGTVMMGLGRCAANVITFWTVHLTSHSVYKIFSIAVGLAVFSFLPMLLTTKEVSLNGITQHESITQVTENIIRGLKSTSMVMRKLWLVQFLAWAAWFCFFPVAGEYFARELFDKDVDEGVQLVALGMIFASVVEILIAAITPQLLEFFSFSFLYCSGFAILASVLAAITFVDKEPVILFFLALTGLSYSFTNTFPFVLVASQFGETTESFGLFVSALDLFTYLAMFVDSLFAPFIKNATVFQIGAAWAALAAIAGLFIRSMNEVDRRREILV